MNYLIMRDLSGELISIKKIESPMSFCEYGDSIVAVTSQNPARVKIFTQTGDTTRSFSLGYSLSQGFISVKHIGNELWICGLYYASGYNGFIEKRNLISGALLWRKNFVGAQPIHATIDTVGNAYVASYYASATDSLTKIDSNGLVVWSKPLSLQQDFYVWDVAIDIKNQIVITGGATTNLQGKTIGYVSAKKMDSGDSVFAFPVVWNANSNSNGISGICCDTSGNFYITGKDYTTTTLCHVRKYHYDTLTGITVVGNENPVGFNLSQSYPNPFNPTTKIQFSVPKKSFVNLVVYDMLGRTVATLVNEVKNPGNYLVDWNSSNLTSGTYFYRMTAGEFTETKKMIMVK
ncbi:MAG: T9SS type A sorting domain-containing protein [Bacteroidetes bacterium]|nr:T9SS type A sorting domain-containing protein [Bacteroidota bacterium]